MASKEYNLLTMMSVMMMEATAGCPKRLLFLAVAQHSFSSGRQIETPMLMMQKCWL